MSRHTRTPSDQSIDPGGLYRQANIFVFEQRSDEQKAADKAATAQLAWLVADNRRKYENRLVLIGIVLFLVVSLSLGLLYLFGAWLGFV
jgi:hypothetical protein